MKLKTTIILVLIVLVSCSMKKEQVYNETVAHVYYNVSDHLEKVYKKFSNGDYITSYESNEVDVDNDKILFNLKNADIRHLNEFVTNSTQQFYMLEPSDDAKEFHASVTQYFDLVKNDFSELLKAYMDCTSPEQKDSITVVVNELYEKISNHEDEMLNIQLEYMKKVGFNPQPR